VDCLANAADSRFQGKRLARLAQLILGQGLPRSLCLPIRL
jgi:hypothetical protein